MKKIFIILALAFSFATHAQSPKWGYGDTILAQDNPDTSYFYQWWCQDWGPGRTHPELKLNFGLNGYGDALLQYNYTPDTVAIVGIALSVVSEDSGRYVDYFRFQEYARLYDATPDSFPLKAEAFIDLSAPHRYMFFEYYDSIDGFTCQVAHPTSRSVPIYECYFNKPVVVADSFYVGMTCNSQNALFGENVGIPDWMVYFNILWSFDLGDLPCPHIPSQLHRMYNFPTIFGPTFYWDYTEDSWFLLVFPLLEPSREMKCPSITGFRLVNINDSHQPLLAWNSSTRHNTWEVSYGPQGIAPHEGTILTTDSPTALLDSIEPNRRYVAYVRAFCEFNGEENYTDWSDTVGIYYWLEPDTSQTDTTQTDTNTHTRPEIISGPQQSDNTFVGVLPNPATHFAQIMSSYALQGYDLVDMNGRTVKSGSLDGHFTKIDISDCAKGLYILLVRTDNGTAAKRLVVE